VSRSCKASAPAPAPVAPDAAAARLAEIGRLVVTLAGQLGVTAGVAGALPPLPAAPSAPAAPSTSPVATPAATPPAHGHHAGPSIKAPLNGTFYRASAPGKPNLAEEGATVKAGEAVCIVEAMKLFNQIKAEKPCKIVAFLAKHGEAVKKGQPLAAIEWL
jgi:acetyl-CoA carboxylase biotin carboxyl carrier protein